MIHTPYFAITHGFTLGRRIIPPADDKQQTSLLRNLAQKLPMPWKMAALVWVTVALLMLAGAAAQFFGWYALSTRLFAYMALGFVGFFVCWLCLAYVTAKEFSARRKAKKMGEQP